MPKLCTDRVIMFCIIGLVAWGIVVLPGIKRLEQIPEQQSRYRANPAQKGAKADPLSALVQSRTAPNGSQTQAEQNTAPNGALNVSRWISGFFEFRLTDVLIVFFTYLLAQKTGGLFTETAGLRTETAALVAFAKRQADDMASSIAAADASAKAATRSADVAERALALTDRPWIKIDIIPTGPLVFDYDQTTLPIRGTWKNIGKSPAIGFVINFEVHEEITIASGRLHDAARQIANVPYLSDAAAGFSTGVTLFPGEDGWWERKPTLKTDTFRARLNTFNVLQLEAAKFKGLNLAVTGFAYYRLPTDSRHTRFRCSSILLEVYCAAKPNGFDGSEDVIAKENIELIHTLFSGPVT